MVKYYDQKDEKIQLWIKKRFLLILFPSSVSQHPLATPCSPMEGSLLSSFDQIVPSMSRFFPGQKFDFILGACNFLTTQYSSSFIPLRLHTEIQSLFMVPSGWESASHLPCLPTCNTNRKGFRGMLMCHYQTFDRQGMSCLEVAINSVDNNWVRDDSNYSL